ncbi:MAG: hypothetical protein R3E97_03470 [Candidatus Eisenbacteria bacterium]
MPPRSGSIRPDDLRASIDRLMQVGATPSLLTEWSGNDSEENFTQLYQALMSYCRVDPLRAVEAVRHARSALEGTSVPRDAALSRLQGHALVSAGQPALATTHYERAADLYHAAGSQSEEARTTIGWSYALSLAGRPSEVEKVARRGRRLLGSADWVSRARLDFNVAGAWQLVGKLERASVAFETARREFLEAGLSADAGLAAHNLGVLALMSGHSEDAIRHCRNAVELFTDLAGTVYPLYSRTIVAAAELTQGRWNEAIESIEALRTGVRGARGRMGGSTRGQRPRVRILGAVEAATPEAEEAVRVFGEAFTEVDAAHAALLHGRLLAIQGRPQAAFQRIELARRHFEARGNRWQSSLTELRAAKVLLGRGYERGGGARGRTVQPYLVRRDPNGGGAIARAVLAEVHLESRRWNRASTRPARTRRREEVSGEARASFLALISPRARSPEGDGGCRPLGAARRAGTRAGAPPVRERGKPGSWSAARESLFDGGAIDIVPRSGVRNASVSRSICSHGAVTESDRGSSPGQSPTPSSRTRARPSWRLRRRDPECGDVGRHFGHLIACPPERDVPARPRLGKTVVGRRLWSGAP